MGGYSGLTFDITAFFASSSGMRRSASSARNARTERSRMTRIDLSFMYYSSDLTRKCIMKEMSLRKLLVLLTLSAAACLAATTTVRGKLTQREGKPPAIEISGKLVIL